MGTESDQVIAVMTEVMVRLAVKLAITEGLRGPLAVTRVKELLEPVSRLVPEVDQSLDESILGM